MFSQTEETLQTLGQFLQHARKRRRWRQKDAAQRVGISVDTLARAEQGSPGIAISIILDLLHLYHRMDVFNQVIDSTLDHVGISMENEKLPKRISTTKYDRDF